MLWGALYAETHLYIDFVLINQYDNSTTLDHVCTGFRKQPALLSPHDVVKSFLGDLLGGLTQIIQFSVYRNNQCALFTRCQFCMVTYKLPP